METFKIEVTQENKGGNIVFSAEQTRNIPEDKAYEGAAREIVNFLRELQGYVKRSEARGFKQIKGLRKSLKTHITLSDLTGEYENKVEFRNLSKALAELENSVIEEQVVDTWEFFDKLRGDCSSYVDGKLKAV